MIRSTIRLLVVALLVALGTARFGWWTVPFIGLAFAMLDRRTPHPVTVAAIGAALGWSALLVVEAVYGIDVAATTAKTAGIFGVPGIVLVAVSLGFAALLCGLAALVGRALMPRRT